MSPVLRPRQARSSSRHDVSSRVVEVSESSTPATVSPMAMLPHWSPDRIRQAQLEDPEIGPVMVMVENQEARPAWGQISSRSKGVKALWVRWKALHLHEGMLWRRMFPVGEEKERFQLIVPRSLQAELLRYHHEAPTAGHLAAERMLAAVTLRFWFPGVRQAVENHCLRCDDCARHKPPRHPQRAGMQTYVVGEPLERVALDILGPLPKTKQGNRYILVIGCHFTKFSEAFALPGIDAPLVARVVVEGFVLRYGCFLECHWDRGTQFTAEVFELVMQYLGIQHTKTVARNSRSNGFVERTNRTILSMLKIYAESQPTTWDERLAHIMFAYRATPQASTGLSPNRMMFGREVSLPLHVVVGQPPRAEPGADPESYVVELQRSMERAHAFAREHLGAAVKRQKIQYDRSSGALRGFQVGQACWYYNTAVPLGRARKFHAKWKGPFVVVSQVNDVLYAIQRSAKERPFVTHVDKLKAYHGDSAPKWFRPPQ